MISKNIIFTEKDKAELLEQEVPEPGRGQYLVKTLYTTISSGTERANITGEVNVSSVSFDTVAHFPRTAGYSAVSEIVRMGEGTHGFEVGEKVIVSWGKHAQYVVIGEENVHKLLDGVSLQDGALLTIATFPLAAIRKCSLEIGESAMVMGQGVLGMIAVKLLKAAGAAPIIAVDPDAKKRENALTIGADYALDPNEPDFAATAKKITNGGVKVAIEVTGLGRGLDQALDCMAWFGRVALLGCTRHSDFNIDYYHKVHGPGISLFGAHTQARPKVESSQRLWTTHDDIMAVEKLISLGRFDLQSLVGEVHSPNEAPEVYHRLVTEKTFPIVQFDWRLLK